VLSLTYQQPSPASGNFPARKFYAPPALSVAIIVHNLAGSYQQKSICNKFWFLVDFKLVNFAFKYKDVPDTASGSVGID